MTFRQTIAYCDENGVHHLIHKEPGGPTLRPPVIDMPDVYIPGARGEERDEGKMVAMYKNGSTILQITREFRCSFHTASQILEKHGVEHAKYKRRKAKHSNDD